MGLFFLYCSINFDSDVMEIYNFENSVEQYASKGGTAKLSVLEQINNFKQKYC